MECKKIGEIATLSQGIQVPIEKQSTINNSDSVRFLRIIDYTQNKDEVRYIDNPGEKYLVDDTDVVMIRYGDAGKVVRGYKGAIANNLFKISIPENLVIKEYLYYYLSQKCIYERLVNNQQKTGLPAVNFKTVNDIEISFPKNLETQKKIVEVLDKAQELIDKRKEQIEELDELVKSRFIEMFGDPVKNSKNWNMELLSEIGTLGRGVSKHRPRNAPELLGGDYPLIQTGDVANCGLYIKEYNATYSELGLKQSKLWDKGTLCITIAANIAKTGILEFDACFPDSVVGFIAGNKTNNIFMNYWFTSFQKLLEAQAPESAQKNINLKILSELKVIMPPIELQNEFADFVNQVDKLKYQMETSLKELEDNFNSLMQKAFKGELF